MFDEPSSYLDVKQRLNAARMIRSMLRHDNYVIVVEHDLSVLDYLSDFVCCLYGEPGAYGVVTMPFTVREGINIFLAGFVPTENLRFRDEELTFRVSASEDTLDLAKQQALKGKSEKEKEALKRQNFSYPRMEKTLGPFHLVVEEGVFGASETVVMLGQNGTGKTTMIKMLAGLMKPDDESIKIPALNISYKPQTIAPKFEGQVQDLFNVKLKDIWTTSLFKTEVLGPLNIEPLLENDVQNLSGGEL
jgi:ATP-binding cassette subfamily E protein 1